MTHEEQTCDCGHPAADHYGGTEDCMECSCTYFLPDVEARGDGSLDAVTPDEEPLPIGYIQGCGAS